MRDAMSEIYKALDELDAVHKKTQVSSTPEEVVHLIQEAQKKFLVCEDLMHKINTLAQDGDFFTKQELEELARRLSSSIEEVGRVQLRVLKDLRASKH